MLSTAGMGRRVRQYLVLRYCAVKIAAEPLPLTNSILNEYKPLMVDTELIKLTTWFLYCYVSWLKRSLVVYILAWRTIFVSTTCGCFRAPAAAAAAAATAT